MIEVLYEDNHILALNKPAGLLTQPTEAEADSLETRAKQWLKEKYDKPGNVFLHAIHRLDRAASGIVVFAKTSKGLSRMMDAIRKQEVKKTYIAQVEKAPSRPSGELVHFLVHDDYRASVADAKTPGAKKAILHYSTLEKKPGRVSLEIDLITGRYHQIRAQLAAIGSPILGDVKYGSLAPWDHPGIALHHSRFEFLHPVTGELLLISSQNG